MRSSASGPELSAETEADELARECAIDPSLSVILQAPAGSGKTSVLTERILRLVAVVDEPEQILAITFTRRAAAEMRARVIRALRGESGDDARGERLRQLAAAALERSRERGWRLAEDPGRLRIQTIDSFNFRLASQLPVSARAGSALAVSSRPEELYLLAARETLLAAQADAELSSDLELLFERLDNRWGLVERLLADMLRQRAHWLRHVLGHEPEVLCRRVAASLTRIVEDRLRAACQTLGAELCAEAARLPGMAGPLGAQGGCLATWKALARLALTGGGDWRRAIDRRLGAGFENGAGKQALRDCIERLGRLPSARETLLDVASLPSPEPAEQDAAALTALSRVLRAAASQLQTLFARDGRVDHTYIAGAARAALAEAGLPTDLALTAGLALRHILVDEFQDTSVPQLELLESLTAGWEPGDGRTLFVVGDPMQSIYLFREAEVGCFLRARDAGIGNVRLTPLRLLRNFRSTAALIQWTNETFARLFPRADDLRESAVAFTASLAGKRGEPGEPAGKGGASGAGGASIELRLLAGAERAAETEAIVARVGDLKARDPRASIAILVAARSHARAIVASLQAREVDAIGVELVPLAEVPIVRDLVALTRALCHVGDRTAWLAVLRAPWCGASLATLTRLSARGDSCLICEALREPQRLEDCPADERSRLERIARLLEEGMSQRERAPLADWLEGVWISLGAPDAYPVEELRQARAFFDALSERTASGEWRGIGTLESVLTSLYAQPQARTDAPVQVLTIHGAKGLEFDHVLVPSLDRERNRGREPLLRWLDLPRAHGSDLLMAPVPAIGEEAPGDVNAYLRCLMNRRAANEQVRLLYVAATRARRSLHLFAAPTPRADGTVAPRQGTLLASLWPALQADFLAAPAGAAPDTAAAIPTRSVSASRLRRLISGWTPRELPPGPQLPRLPLAQRSLETVEFSWVGETRRHIGTVVHAALEAFAADELPSGASLESRAELYREQLRRHGVPERDLARAADEVVQALSRTVADERGCWILSRGHGQAASELALTGMAGGELRSVVIDRSFIDERGTRWVIDFKTSRHEGGRLEEFISQELERYRGQLEVYAALARGLGPEPVRAALYFPLLGAFRELR